MKKFFRFGAALLLPALLAASGCNLEETIEKLEKSDVQVEPEYVISIHEIVRYPKAEALEREIDTFSGTKMYVNVNSFLHSRNVKKIDIAVRPDEPGFYDLVLHLDKRGMMLWSSVAAQFRGRKLALVVDGICYRVFTPQMPAAADLEEDPEKLTVLLEGPIDKATAESIAKHSEKNYDIFN